MDLSTINWGFESAEMIRSNPSENQFVDITSSSDSGFDSTIALHDVISNPLAADSGLISNFMLHEIFLEQWNKKISSRS